MNKLPSSEFRKTYASLTVPTEVTVNGHVIGEWRPLSPIQQLTRAATLTEEETLKFARAISPADAATASIVGNPNPLRKIAQDDRFNSQPFRGPIPKKR
jgi:hypothetical protein